MYMKINETSDNLVSLSLRQDMDLIIHPTRCCTRKISFIAKAKYNNTVIQCVLLEYGVGSVESDEVTLTVQGK